MRIPQSRPGQSSAIAALIVFVLFIAIAAYAYESYNTGQAQQAPANLSLSSGQISNATAMEQYTFSFEVTNTGGNARNVVLTLQSPSFTSVTLSPKNIGQGRYISETATVQLNDVQNGQYQILANISYQDSSGTHTTQATFSYYLLPKVQITGFAWQGSSLLGAGKDKIGRNDQTSFTFDVEGNSKVSTYIHLTASVGIGSTVEDLTYSPTLLSVSDIGPNGITHGYSFTISSNGTPVGTYPIHIYVWADGVLAAQHTVQLTVTD